jgi:hypothetical protein
MKVSDMIRLLEEFRAEHGDLPVERFGVDCNRQAAAPPRLEHRKILKGRESCPRFWQSYNEPDRKGEPVCKL